MEQGYRKWVKQGLAVLLGWMVSVMCWAQSSATVMTVASWLPPGHPQNAVVLPTWGRWIEQATQGRVTLKVEYGLGAPPAIFDLVEDGVADAGWSFHGFVPGRFVLTQVVEQPGLAAGPEAASVAYWRVYQKYFAQENEHEGLHLAALFTHGPGLIQLREPISSMAELRGKKIRIGGGVQTAIGERMGVTHVPSPGSQVYEFLHEKIVDGAFLPMSEQRSQRLYEVAPYVVVPPGGMYLGSFGLVVNPDFLAGLDEVDRQAILSVSGEKLSALAGRAWAQGDVAGYEAARRHGVTVVRLSVDEPMALEYQRLMRGVEQDWTYKASQRADNPAQALAELREIARGL